MSFRWRIKFSGRTPRRKSDIDPYSPLGVVLAGTGSQEEVLFRNAADEGRTHAYIAPEESAERIGLSPRTLSTARSESAIETTSRSSRVANMPACVEVAGLCAPVARAGVQTGRPLA